jgi:asparagine synthetase B (glutamine-hydrolysing)
MGFGVPLDHWFRGELRPLLYDTLLDSRSLSRGYFKPESVRRLVEEHDERRWDHSYRLWALLCFELWQRTWLDSAVPPQSPVADIVDLHAARRGLGSQGTLRPLGSVRKQSDS